MRYSLMSCLAAAVALVVPAALAQQRAKISIDNVRIGFSSAAEAGEPLDEKERASYFKPGAWTPIYVDITAGGEGIESGDVVIEVNDSDDIQNHYTVALPRLNPLEQYRILTYTKLGSAGGDLITTIHADNRTVTVKKSYGAYDAFSLGEMLYLSVGSRLPGLRRRFYDMNQIRDNPQQNANQSPYYRGRTAYVDDVDALPTRWFGYGSVDLMILTTGNLDFLTRLLDDRRNRKEAMAEWVRRGGRLVVSTGRNQDVAAKLLAQMQITLPVNMTGTRAVDRLVDLEKWFEKPVLPFKNAPTRDGKVAPIDVVRLEPAGKEFEALLTLASDKDPQPIILRAPHGMGQVMLVAFDLDQPPFTAWGSQQEFWGKLLIQSTNYLPKDPNQTHNIQINRGAFGQDDSGNELAAALQNSLEQFDDIPVISFGWVALFILVYIIIVGPLDYLFLKKVVKRLELTWITFPTVVVVVSAAAYFAAYSIKGNDLKINKIDVIDIDLANQKTYGQTWFTLFSPRIQLYTIGVEPAAPDWAAEVEDRGKPASVLVSWLGRPGTGFGDYGRPRSQSLFRRAYDYAPDGTGVVGVPIQVWSSKSFSAAWERPLDPNRLPFQADLKHPRGDPREIIGSIENQLPVAIDDAYLIYGEGTTSRRSSFPLGQLMPKTPKNIHIRPGEQVPPLNNWVSGGVQLGNLSSHGGSVGPEGSLSIIKRTLFYDAGVQEGARNNALRHLDQMWRLHNKDQAILFGRITFNKGPAETVTRAPGTPSRLWLGQLPTVAENRPALSGTLQQETYVRVILQVNSKKD